MNSTYMLFIGILCWQAWSALSSLSLNKTYLRPGITPPVDDGGTNGSYSARERSTVKVTCSTDGSFYSNNQQNQSQMGVPGTGRNFHSFPPPVPGDGKIFAEKFPRINDEAREPETCSAHLNGVEKPFRSSAFAAEQLGSGEACLDEIDDDILQVMVPVQLPHNFPFFSTLCEEASFYQFRKDPEASLRHGFVFKIC